MANRLNNAGFVASSSQNFTHVLNWLGLNLTTKKVGLYRVSLASRNPLTLDLKNYAGVMTAKIAVKDQVGNNSSLLKGDVEDPNGEMSFEYRDDLIAQQSNSYGSLKGFLDTIFDGGVINVKGEKVRVLSTAGVLFTEGRATPCDQNYEFGSLFAHEIRNLFDGQAYHIEGNRILGSHTYLLSLQDESNAVMMECIQRVGKDVRSFMIPALFSKSLTYAQNEGTEGVITAEVERCCEIWERDTLFADGTYLDGSDSDLDKLEYKVDYIVESSGGVSPTDFGIGGEKICVVCADTGAFTIQESDGSAWITVGVGTFREDARIFATKYTTDTLENAKDQNHFVTVKTAGADNSGVANSFILDLTGSLTEYTAYGVGFYGEGFYGGINTAKSFVCPVYQMNRTIGEIDEYVTLSIC